MCIRDSPGAGRQAADAGMGADPERRTQLSAPRLVDHHLSGAGDYDHGVVDQPARRRPARRPGAAHDALISTQRRKGAKDSRMFSVFASLHLCVSAVHLFLILSTKEHWYDSCLLYTSRCV